MRASHETRCQRLYQQDKKMRKRYLKTCRDKHTKACMRLRKSWNSVSNTYARKCQ